MHGEGTTAVMAPARRLELVSYYIILYNAYYQKRAAACLSVAMELALGYALISLSLGYTGALFEAIYLKSKHFLKGALRGLKKAVRIFCVKFCHPLAWYLNNNL
jgi:hypothetical protein